MRNLPTFEEFEQRQQAQGYERVLVREWGPNVANSQHMHDFDASGLVVQGEMWIECADRTLHMFPGDTFELPRGTPHLERYGPDGAVYWASRRTAPCNDATASCDHGRAPVDAGTAPAGAGGASVGAVVAVSAPGTAI